MKQINWCKILGITLLISPIIGVLLFIIGLAGIIVPLKSFEDSTFWIGMAIYYPHVFYSGETSNVNICFTSPIPIYLGLMAIAGAILFKTENKGNHA